MSKVILLCLLLVGCASAGESNGGFCEISSEQRDIIRQNLEPILMEITQDPFYYTIGMSNSDEFNLILFEGNCYAYLNPHSKVGDVLDGDGWAPINMRTLIPGEIQWFAY